MRTVLMASPLGFLHLNITRILGLNCPPPSADPVDRNTTILCLETVNSDGISILDLVQLYHWSATTADNSVMEQL